MPNTKRLGAVIAREAQVRKAVMRKLTDSYHALAVPDLLGGILGTYEPKDAENGEPLPPEGKRVQATVEEMIAKTREVLGEMYDATAARDYTNCSGTAFADVVVDGTVLIAKAPVPYLLWLDKQLDELTAFANRIPTLSADTTWTTDERRGTYVSAPVQTVRQVNLPTVITLSQATEKHAANAQLQMVPTTVGTWTRRKYSGAVPVERKEAILHRLNQLKEAVAVARAQANGTDAVEPEIGKGLMDFVFAGAPGE